MCGIIGIVRDDPAPDPDMLVRMRDTLSHRGPDDAFAWWNDDRRIGLGHRRLAVIDLSPGGRQPMFDGGNVIVFNGEIYNYRDLRTELQQHGVVFSTASDTEVLLKGYARWGDALLERLIGQFAFGLYDGGRRRLLLARDRAGEKPLFYAKREARFTFASELKALMADPAFPRRIDPISLDAYFAYGYVPHDRCIFEGVHKLAPAHALSFDVATGAVRTWAYWTLPEPPVDEHDPDARFVDEYDALLSDSVRRQLVADVPVGILLSGGIDSSLVAAQAVRAAGREVRTFTITFPGHAGYDEGPYARLVADHLGTVHTELVAEPATADLVPLLARQYDEPMADSSMVPTYLVSRLIREHATVALGGDGGDELFGGYNHYSWIQQQERARRFMPRPLRQLVGAGVARLAPPGLRGRNYAIGFTADLAQSIAHVNLYFDKWTRRRLLAPIGSTLDDTAAEQARQRWCNPSHSPLRQAMEADFRTTLVDAYLVKVDRASMLSSLEVRAPFLDHRLIEFAFGRVPDRLKATVHRRKILSKVLAGRYLPPALDLERKQGFSMPLSAWFKGAWGTFIESVLRDADPTIFDRKVTQQLLDGQRRGFSNTGRLYALTFFELWRREYQATL
jgi:asparagine synthase (glutamine-hydrolysing)